MPVLLKPRSQTLTGLGVKGLRVDRPDELVASWRRLRDAQTIHAQVLSRAPDWALPVVQSYCGGESIYTVDGFADSSSRIVAALACTKLLQMPRGSGPGILFTPAPLDLDLLGGLEELCRLTGHIGVFDAEFAIDADQRLLIDFNPRFYNHMAYEIRRGLPLPWLSYLAAVEDDSSFRREIAAIKPVASKAHVYVHRFPARIMLCVQRQVGAMSAHECRGWHSVQSGATITDPAYEAGDPLPAVADIALLLKHPRSLYRKLGAPR